MARRWWSLVAVALATFMTYLDNNVTNVAIPTIQRDLHLSIAGLEWVVSSYILVFAALLLVGGRLADVFGRRRLFFVGLTIFTAASLGAGLAGSGGVLIGMRLVQGLGAALLVPTTLAIIVATFRNPRERTTAVVGAIALCCSLALFAALQPTTPLWVLVLALAGSGGSAAAIAQPPKPGAKGYEVEWVYRVRYGFIDEWWDIFRKYQIPILEREKALGYVLDYRVYHPQLHVDEASRWDYRVEITYKDAEGARHEEEVTNALFPDSATRKREENRRWELTTNHWDLPIYQVDVSRSR